MAAAISGCFVIFFSRRDLTRTRNAVPVAAG
jgi:hypothetical protein